MNMADIMKHVPELEQQALNTVQAVWYPRQSLLWLVFSLKIQ
jgi:hypothetical protein